MALSPATRLNEQNLHTVHHSQEGQNFIYMGKGSTVEFWGNIVGKNWPRLIRKTPIRFIVLGLDETRGRKKLDKNVVPQILGEECSPIICTNSIYPGGLGNKVPIMRSYDKGCPHESLLFIRTSTTGTAGSSVPFFLGDLGKKATNFLSLKGGVN